MCKLSKNFDTDYDSLPGGIFSYGGGTSMISMNAKSSGHGCIAFVFATGKVSPGGDGCGCELGSGYHDTTGTAGAG